MIKLNVNDNIKKNQFLILLFLYCTVLVSFLLGEDSTGGAHIDYPINNLLITKFSENFTLTFLTYDEYSHRHSPVLLIFLSLFKKINFNFEIIRIIHLHLCLLLPISFFYCLKIKYPQCDRNILYLLTGLIFISPTFRTLSIWPDSRILGLTFFTISIYYFIRFQKTQKFESILKNIIFLSFSSYISPNFSVFSVFFFLFYIKHFGFFTKNIFLIIFTNLILAFPAFYYIFILDINFLAQSAAVGRETNKIIFYNLSNDILISFSIILFYLLPFLVLRVIKLKNIYNIKNIFFSCIIFFYCIFNFDYQVDHTGGGIFLKLSQYFFENNFFFYTISLIAIIVLLPIFFKNIYNLIFLILIFLNNPQYTIYHKYFDPFIIIIFFTLLILEIDLMKLQKNLNKFLFIYFYFLIFLILSLLKNYA